MRHPRTKSQPKPKSKEAERIPSADISLFQGPLSEGFERDLETADGKDSALVKRVANVVLSIVHEESFSGPLPHPKDLAAYDQIHPGAADRIIAMAEKEQAHRHAWEDKSLKFDFSYSILGIFLGFLIALALLLLAYVSSQAGHQNVALAFLAASTVGMVASFIKGRSWLTDQAAGPGQEPERERK
jgi:uncharacterized membrane protein